MDILTSLLMGIIEGATEFLPISSTGHLILGSHILGLAQTEFLKSFEIIIQVGAIIAITLASKKILIHNWKKLYLLIFYSFIPSAILGLLFYKTFKEYLIGNQLVVIASLSIGGVLMILFEKLLIKRTINTRTISEITIKDAVLIGILQSISIIPGVSRSAVTIIGGMIIGLQREDAVLYSFILAIPTMIAATLYDIYKSSLQFTSPQMVSLGIGTIASGITAYISAIWLMRYIKHNSFIPFGYYRILLALLFILLFIR